MAYSFVRPLRVDIDDDQSPLDRLPRYRQEEISCNRVIDLIRDCRYSIPELRDAGGGVVICGLRQWYQCRSEISEMLGPGSFASPEIGMRYFMGGEPEVMNMKVVVVSWFDGVVVVPRNLLPGGSPSGPAINPARKIAPESIPDLRVPGAVRDIDFCRE